jgi:hypothetical protein
MNSKLNLYKLTVKETQKTKAGIIWQGCGCACAYVNCGGSSTIDNYNANNLQELWSDPWTPQC